jgi:hypothetical protein
VIHQRGTKDQGFGAIFRTASREFFRIALCAPGYDRDRSIAIYQPICLVNQCSATDMEELNLYREVLRLYCEQNWLLAEEKFVDLQRRFPDQNLCRFYARRIEFFREH